MRGDPERVEAKGRDDGGLERLTRSDQIAEREGFVVWDVVVRDALDRAVPEALRELALRRGAACTEAGSAATA
jgi:hypothetical protein